MRGNTVGMKLTRGQLNRAEYPLFQYDYGQVLILSGVKLPNAYEVHFSNTPSGNSKTSIGNADGVSIPDEFLLSGENVYVWLFLHDGESDGETEYRGIISVTKRAKPTNQEPTPVQQDIITQTIAALNAAVAQANADVEKYPGIVNDEWCVWDEAEQAFVPTGVPATGNGIESAVLNDDYTLTLTWMNGDHYTTPPIRGATGATGATPQLSIGTVTTGQPGTSAVVTITGTAEQPVLNFTIPKGDPGDLTSADIASEAETQAMINDYYGG